MTDRLLEDAIDKTMENSEAYAYQVTLRYPFENFQHNRRLVYQKLGEDTHDETGTDGEIYDHYWTVSTADTAFEIIKALGTLSLLGEVQILYEKSERDSDEDDLAILEALHDPNQNEQKS